VNLEVMEAEIAQFDGLALMAKCGRIKCDIRDKSGCMWETINSCWDKTSGKWKSGTVLEDVKNAVLKGLWDEKEQRRVEQSQKQKGGEDPLSPGKPGAKATQPAQKYEAGCWLGPPWWIAYPHGTNPARWCVNPKTDEGKGGAILAGSKGGAPRSKDRARGKQEKSQVQQDALEKYQSQRSAAGGSSGEKEILAVLHANEGLGFGV
jgi:hypothetical protein